MGCQNGRFSGFKARSDKAADHAVSLAPIIARLDPDSSLSLRALAAKLTAEGLPTPAGAAVWTAAGVARVKAKLLRPDRSSLRRAAQSFFPVESLSSA